MFNTPDIRFNIRTRGKTTAVFRILFVFFSYPDLTQNMKTDPDPFFICLIFSNFFIFIFELLKKCSLSVPLFNMPKGAKNKILYTFKLIN